MADPVKDDTARSPIAGCAILIIALLVMAFLIVFSVVVLFRQFDAISKFTDEQAKPVAVSTVEGNERELNALAERVELFRQQLNEFDDKAVLEVSADEINLAIAAYSHFDELRETFYITEIGEDAMRINISFMLNGKPRMSKEGEGGIIQSDNRYLNAVMVARPVLLKQEVVLKIDDIQVEGVDVPREFIEQMSPYRLAERYLTDDVLGPAMGQLTRVDLEDGKVVLMKTPGEIPGDMITDEEVDVAGTRFLVIFGSAACLFLLFAGVIVFIGLRKTAKDVQ